MILVGDNLVRNRDRRKAAQKNISETMEFLEGKLCN